MSTLSAKPLTPSNINPSPSPSPSLMSGKPRRKPVNYDKNAASSEIESALSNSTTASSPSLAPVPSTVPATESPMFTHKNTSLSTLNTPIRTVPNQQRTATTDTSVNNRSSPVTSHSPLPPPPRTVSATPLRVVVPKYIADGERPISASLGSLDSGYKPPSSPRSDRDRYRTDQLLTPCYSTDTASIDSSYKSAPSLYSSPLTLSAEDSAKIALESDPQKREIASLRHLCENLQKEREELLTKYKRRAHFGTAKLADDPVITETLKKLTDDAEKRKMEQKDLHAAIEMLMRRIFALEKQVETLGAKPGIF
ncbi:hypothetical protein DFS34DRAFT_437595 [Phlyctochytrium arcticum]|nr:hypothetical protein DFS34DRAFT_437595 [Phlyctochytrium arcticum]